MATPKVGQVWRGWDRRERHVSNAAKAFTITAIDGDYAVCKSHRDGIERRILLKRLKPNSTGYKLLSDTTTPSAARHEHYWGNVHGRQFRMTWYSCGWWFVEERDKHGGSWSPIDIDADVTDELARLAGLVPPEER